jgi:hypothetical protein
MATKLHQLIAVARGVTPDTAAKLSRVKQVLAIKGDQSPLTGIIRTYQPRDADGDELPAETRRVQITALDLLKLTSGALTRLFDVQFSRELTNCYARADLVVDGETLLADVPATYFLFLETQLTELLTGLIERLPELNPAEEWHGDDPGQPRGVWVTPPRVTTRPAKVPQVQVLYPATPEHPAQVRPYDTDKIVGDWTMVKLSGELPARQVEAIRDRAATLLAAVRAAREEANGEDVRDRHAGDAVLGYLFAPALGDGGSVSD